MYTDRFFGFDLCSSVARSFSASSSYFERLIWFQRPLPYGRGSVRLLKTHFKQMNTHNLCSSVANTFSAPSLEPERQRELDYPRGPCCRDLTELRVRLFACGIEPRGSVYARILTVIKGVIELGAELHHPPVREDREILEQGGVPIIRSRH